MHRVDAGGHQPLRIERRAAGTRNGAFANFSYPSNGVTMQVSYTPNSVIARVREFAVPELVLYCR